MQFENRFLFAVIDAPGVEVFSLTKPAWDTTCNGTPAGAVIFTACWGGAGKLLYSGDPSFPSRTFFTADISALAGMNFDTVYLSVTELRTAHALTGTVWVYITNNAIPIAYPGQDDPPVAFLQGVDATLADGLTAVGDLKGTGIGGNHLLLDMTSAIRFALAKGIHVVGIYLQDEVPDGLQLALLGSNYNSGYSSCNQVQLEVCQYYASSLYEYPTLIATSGTDITPFELLPPRPIINDPLAPLGAIDIKPGIDPNTINVRNKGDIPVAILSTDTFNATTQMNLDSVRFGPKGAPIDKRMGVDFEDVNGDGLLDVVAHFSTLATGLACGDTYALLTGLTVQYRPTIGADHIVAVGCK
jgi:hypothetical protein